MDDTIEADFLVSAKRISETELLVQLDSDQVVMPLDSSRLEVPIKITRHQNPDCSVSATVAFIIPQ